MWSIFSLVRRLFFKWLQFTFKVGCNSYHLTTNLCFKEASLELGVVKEILSPRFIINLIWGYYINTAFWEKRVRTTWRCPAALLELLKMILLTCSINIKPLACRSTRFVLTECSSQLVIAQTFNYLIHWCFLFTDVFSILHPVTQIQLWNLARVIWIW